MTETFTERDPATGQIIRSGLSTEDARARGALSRSSGLKDKVDKLLIEVGYAPEDLDNVPESDRLLGELAVGKKAGSLQALKIIQARKVEKTVQATPEWNAGDPCPYCFANTHLSSRTASKIIKIIAEIRSEDGNPDADQQPAGPVWGLQTIEDDEIETTYNHE